MVNPAFSAMSVNQAMRGGWGVACALAFSAIAPGGQHMAPLASRSRRPRRREYRAGDIVPPTMGADRAAGQARGQAWKVCRKRHTRVYRGAPFSDIVFVCQAYPRDFPACLQS